MAFTEQPLKGLDDLLDQPLVDNFNHGRAEEIIQPLADLGYLKIRATEGEIAPLDEIKAAIRAFQDDVLAEQLLTQPDIADAIDQAKVIPDLIVSPQTLKLLHVLTSIEGDFDFSPSLLQAGTTNLYSRILHYRMELFGLWDYEQIDQPFSTKSTDKLKRLVRWLDLPSISEVYSLLGNLPDLVNRLQESTLFQESLIVFEYEPDDFSPKHFQHEEVFEKQIKKSYGRKSKVREQFKENAKEPNASQLQKLHNTNRTSYNLFLLRVVQLTQWVNGYYMGKLDSDLKEMTFESLNEMVRTEVEFGNTDFQLQLLVYYVKDGCWVLNARYLFEEVIKDQLFDNISQNEISEAFHHFQQTYEEAEAKGNTEVMDELNKAWKAVNKESSGNLKSKHSFTRRIYFGFKSFFQRIKRGIQQIFKNIKRFIEKAKNLFKNITKKLFSEIREGLRLFRQGYRYLFGHRKIESADQKVTTHFSLDSDAISIIRDNTTNELLRKHQKRIAYFSESLTFSLTLTGRVIHYIATAVISGGMALLVKMALELKDMIREKLSQKQEVPGSFVNIVI